MNARRCRAVALFLWAGAVLSPLPAEQPPFEGLTLLLDFDQHPVRLLAAYREPLPPRHLWPLRIEGDPVAWLRSNHPSQSAHLLTFHDRQGGELSIHGLEEETAAFADTIDRSARSDLSGGLAPAADLRLVHLPVPAGAELLMISSARAGSGYGASGDAAAPIDTGVDLEVSGVFRLGEDEAKSPPVTLKLGSVLLVDRPSRARALPEPATPDPSYNVVRIAGSLPPKRGFDLVVLGDGFTKAELPQLRLRVEDFASRLLGDPDECTRPGIPPFSEPGIRELVSIWLVEAESADSHVTFCPCCAAEKKTAFKVRGNFKRGGSPTDFDTDDPAALERAVRRVGKSIWIEGRMVVPNCERYGGRGFRARRLAFVPVVPDLELFANLAIHELSHAVADLGDEYLSCSVERNVSVAFRNVATPKQVAAGLVPWRGLARPDEYDSATGRFRVRHECLEPAPVGDDAAALGLFWGAQFIEMSASPCECDKKTPDSRLCGYYRPANACKMRALASPFCRVCAHELRCAIRRAAGIDHPDCDP